MSKIVSLKTKIILLFLIPASVLIYFSYDYMEVKSRQLSEAERLEFVSKQTQRLTQLIRNIQLERGLSAGYIVSKDKSTLQERLRQQFLQTDTIVHRCRQSANKNQEILKEVLTKERLEKIKPLSQKIFSKLASIHTIRKKIYNSKISFDDEIKYYSSINNAAINLMKFLLLVLQEENPDSIALLNIEKTKEFAGLERACIYNQLLSQEYDPNCKQQIFYLTKEQQTQIDEFHLYASQNTQKIFNTTINKKNLDYLKELEEKFLNYELRYSDAQKWFNVATNYIDELNLVSDKILENYIHIAQNNYKKSSTALYIAIFLWVIVVLSTTYITILLNRLFEKEKKQLEELRIAAYTFDSQEAIAITDLNEKIIKINKGFSDITGYSEEEALGKTPRLLRSDKHSKEFFKKMWKTIEEKGRWKGDIYNKRKNGEIYPERLSITAIKNEKGKITNYIAHFLDISDLKKAQEEAEHQANHDVLTGIANRKLLMEILNKELAKAKRHNLIHAFMFLDLDHFKSINDKYGHHVGDLLIQYTAKVLKESVRKEDFVARISGDEFAVLLLNLNEDKVLYTAERIASKILFELSKEIEIEKHRLTISSSIGIRIFPLDKDENIETIIKDADAAMYKAKTEGKNRFVVSQ